MSINIKALIDKVSNIYKYEEEELIFNKEDVSKDISEFEAKFDVTLPDSLKQLYSISNGIDNAVGVIEVEENLFFGIRISPLKSGIDEYNNLSSEYAYWKKSRHKVWKKNPQVDWLFRENKKFQFASSTVSDMAYYLDFDPSEKGVVGQVIGYDMDGVYYFSESFDEFFNQIASCFFEKYNDANIFYRLPKLLRKDIENDDLDSFKKNYHSDSDPTINMYLAKGHNIATYSDYCKSKKILKYIFNELKYSNENYLVDAICGDNAKLVNYLLDGKLDVNALVGGNEESLLSALSSIHSELSLKVVAEIINRGADVNYMWSSETILDQLFRLDTDDDCNCTLSEIGKKMVRLIRRNGGTLEEEDDDDDDYEFYGEFLKEIMAS
ncbi:MAG: hypothetical protein COA79_22085 [Planctomycetota bacterium]|nr:MAG: hypothetical protein COA79_22085 [Planctomycetota bacterium]